jgi:hypothetical protein
MVMLNTTGTPTARNISTADLSSDGIVRSGLVYVAAIGDRGALVQFGGATRPTGIPSEANDTLVSMSIPSFIS